MPKALIIAVIILKQESFEYRLLVALIVGAFWASIFWFARWVKERRLRKKK